MSKPRSRGGPARRPSAPATLILTLILAAALAGCSGPPRGAPVDPPRARDALKAALEGWKKGESTTSFKAGSPPMTIQDFDWEGGAKLVDYQLAGEGKSEDANLRIPVDLTLTTPDGKEVKKTIRYIVGTSPSLTVFRAFR